MAAQKPPPKFLNLLVIRLPPGGMTSIAHRISGILMFLSIPLFAWLFSTSLQDSQGFRQAGDILRHPLLQWASVLMVWSLVHHLLAGIRHLFLDVEIGIDRGTARLSAVLINITGLVVTLVYAVVLL